MNKIETLLEGFLQEMAANNLKYELLEENYAQLAMKIDSANGWAEANDFTDGASGPTLQELHVISKNLRQLTEQNPLLKRGCELRGSYVFGNGVTFRNVKPAAQKVIDSWSVKRAMFSRQGQFELNKAKYTDGNVFILHNKKTNHVMRIPISQIQGFVCNPDDSEDIWMFKRVWEDQTNKTQEFWYYTSTAPNTKVKKGDKAPEKPRSEYVMFHETANRQVGWSLGVPDAMAAVLWAMAYSHYLNNNATLVEKYAAFAAKITTTNKTAADSVAASVRERGSVGGVAVQSAGTDLSMLPATGSQVNFNNGQPLAAMVAASLGVSVIALVSSPAAAGGSYGAAATLDAPTIIGMSAIQDTWALFYEQFLHTLGSKDALAEFPSIETDATYRTIGQLPSLVEAGLLHREEARDIVIDLLDVRDPKMELPEIEVPKEPTVPNEKGENGKDNIEQGDTDNNDRTDLISK